MRAGIKQVADGHVEKADDAGESLPLPLVGRFKQGALGREALRAIFGSQLRMEKHEVPWDCPFVFVADGFPKLQRLSFF